MRGIGSILKLLIVEINELNGGKNNKERNL